MFNSFKIGSLATTFALVSISAINSLTAWNCCQSESENRFYVGAFGGQLYSDTNKMQQYGTAFFLEAQGGPLPVIAEGNLNKTEPGFGGIQFGYEMSKPSSSCWSLATAGELEVFFFNQKKNGHLINQTVIGLPEHDFANSFHLDSTVILTNVVLSVKTDSLFGFTPYVGGGIGAARLSISKADSLQMDPLEAGINHFNSNRSDSNWAFAAQAKAGLRYNFCESFHIFAEYRYLYVDSSNYILGATNYTTHAPTSPWNIKLKETNYNAFAIGFQFDL